MLHHLVDEMLRFKAEDKLILGICNGFQVLMKSPVLLDSDAAAGPAATLTLTTAAGIRIAGSAWRRTARSAYF